MSRFLTPLHLRCVPPNLFRMAFPLRYLSDIAGGIIDVEEGFITDLASIPVIFTIVVPKRGPWDGPCVLHDKMYFHNGIIPVTAQDGHRFAARFTRKQCDDILLEAMTALGVPDLSRQEIYLGVRLGGQSAWDQHLAEGNVAKL